jgi:hypothetical protein
LVFYRFSSMRPLVLTIILTFLLSQAMHAQKSGQTDFELGLSGGVSWYNGDINPYAHFSNNYWHESVGVSLRRNLNQRFVLRAQINFGHISADDIQSSSQFQSNRNLNFSSPLYEAASTLEFNFLPFDALINKHRFSPYSFIGIAGFYFNPSTIIEGSVYELQPLETEGESYLQYGISIPFGFGFKLALNDRIIVSTDWGLRKTFTDYLDDVSAVYPNQSDISGLSQDISDRSLVQSGPDGTNWGTQRGNSVTKDYYTFAMVTLAVRLGPKKGSCKHLRI